MKIRLLLLTIFFPTVMGRVPPTSQAGPIAPALAVRSYNGTASLGDVFNFTLDPVAYTLSYSDLSNGDNETISYQVNSDGTYQLEDPLRNLVLAYEIPNHILLIEAANTGPNHDDSALILALRHSEISVSKWANGNYNFMKFSSLSGGVEVGFITTDGQGNASISAYWPLAGLDGANRAFHRGGFSARNLLEDASQTFLRLPDNNGGSHYIFGSAGRTFSVDTPNGMIVGLRQTASKAFDPGFAGAYRAMFYQKSTAQRGMDDEETGVSRLGKGVLLIGRDGLITVKEEMGNILVQAPLTPAADSPYLHGNSALQDPCFGLFTFRFQAASLQREVFVSFMDRAVLFSSFQADLPWNDGHTYTYLYGVGLK